MGLKLHKKKSIEVFLLWRVPFYGFLWECEILKRDRRCFVCLKTNHQSGSCKKNCHWCHGNHHWSICGQVIPKYSGSPGPTKQNWQEMQNSTLVSYTTENVPPVEITMKASSATKGTVLLQTSTAIARNEDDSKKTTAKMLFDDGGQHSYVTNSLKSKLGLKSTRTRILHLNIFGEREFQK